MEFDEDAVFKKSLQLTLSNYKLEMKNAVPFGKYYPMYENERNLKRFTVYKHLDITLGRMWRVFL